jgi:proline iminopeptidase
MCNFRPVRPFFAIAILALLASPSLCSAEVEPTEVELKDNAGRTIVRYVVEAPAGVAAAGTQDPAKQVGLILCSAEHDRPTGDEILPVREALLRLGLRDRYVLLAGHSQAQKFGPADDEPLEKLIRWAIKTYPVNPRRVYMYGKGEGGKISGEFTMLHPDLVTAGISYSWGMWRMPAEVAPNGKDALDPLTAPEFYMVLGLRDLSYHLTTVRDAWQRMTAKGYHVIYREFEDLGARTHHPPSNDDSIAWATRLRNKNLPVSPQERALLAKTEINSEGYIGNLALVGGSPAGAVIQKLLESSNPDIRAAAAATCSHAIFDEVTMEALSKRAYDPSTKVRQSAFRALAINANWRSNTAERALVESALHPEKAIAEADRVAAVDGIAYAVQFQLRGARQDPLLFAALITLLTDKNEELRTMATNILAPIRDPAFRGDLGRTEQKTPSGGWQPWLDGVTAKAAGYRSDYHVCANQTSGGMSPMDLYCQGGGLSKDPVQAFRKTLQSAEQGYVPAEAMVGMFYAVGKGTLQSYPDAVQWWTKAAESGHSLAAQSLSMAYRGVAGVKSDPVLSAKWAKIAQDRVPAIPSGHVPTPDVDLVYWILGQPSASTPVIAVNGGPGLSHIYMWQNDVWPRLAQYQQRDRQIVFYDQRGTGASALVRPDAPQTMEAQVADLDAVRDHLHFNTIDLVGDSYGGLLAMAYTAAHPERVRRLVLSDSAAPAWNGIVHLFPQVFPDKLEAQAKPANTDTGSPADQGLRNHFEKIFYSEEKRDAYLAGAKDLGSNPKTGADVRKATPNLDLTSALAKFQCPTLVITGRYDMNVAPLTAWRIFQAIPGARFSVFEKSGHLPYYEEPEKYVQVLGEFLDGK